MTLSRRAVFLDRDGVLNRTTVRGGKPYAPRRLEDFRLLPGVAAAVSELRAAGFFVAVVTNQPDIGNGDLAPEVLAAMHRRLGERVPVDAILVCPHGQTAGCDCRKPKPGLLRRAAAEHGLDLAASFMVGDRVSDVLAGAAAGCYTVFLNRGYAESCEQRFHPDQEARSLSGAVRLILSQLGRAEKVPPR